MSIPAFNINTKSNHIKQILLVSVYLISLWIAHRVTKVVMSPTNTWYRESENESINKIITEFKSTYPSYSTRNANPFNPVTTYNRLQSKFPYLAHYENDNNHTKSTIPKTIHQFTDFVSKTEDEDGKTTTAYQLKLTWASLNPNYEVKQWETQDLINFVEENFKTTIPEIHEAFNLLLPPSYQSQWVIHKSKS
ncbi:unnamed protein product [Ambrosiozyma monospora]|uniref:Unnamed protein product n=1 Tax=Ambrosiozyma monospora TaxID=43982 RepID=A0ACB5TNF5_AMBMO|nr:unnamed protein product [Ambrosiozyma monospora]